MASPEECEVELTFDPSDNSWDLYTSWHMDWHVGDKLNILGVSYVIDKVYSLHNCHLVEERTVG